jgi:cell division protein FtsN
VKRGIPAFTLQIGAFKEKRYADKLYWGLKKKYGDIVYIGQIGEYWKVRIGEYFSLEEARSAQRKFRSEGFPNTWIVRIMR